MNKMYLFSILFLISLVSNSSWMDYFKSLTIVNNAPNFSAITNTSERKIAFFKYLKPIIVEQNALILQLRNKIINHKLSNEFIVKLARKYRIKPQNISIESLLKKIDIIPTSLALAQGAIESNWGRSRFASYNNYYGIWCFKKGCGVVPNKRNLNAKHEVATFKTINEATRKYILNLNSHPAYAKLRDIRYELRKKSLTIDGGLLSEGLNKYSGIGNEYIKILQKMIIYNKL